MKLQIISTPDTVGHFLEIAELDRIAWLGSDGADFVPDGEHSWRVWSEYSFVVAALDESSKILGVICSFDTNVDSLHFFHKIFIRADERHKGIGLALMRIYCDYLDSRLLDAIMTTVPNNFPMIGLSDLFGFETQEEIAGYYRDDEDRLLRRRKSNPKAY